MDKTGIVLCADDFGMHAAVDEAVLALADQGGLQATSCLSLGPSLRRHARALRDAPIQAGLHLNFTEALDDPDGLYLPLGRLMRVAWLRQLDTRRVKAQVARQLDAFEAALGQAPHFIDGHQHVHQFPVIRDALLDEVARRYPLTPPWLRSTRAGPMAGLPWGLRGKAKVIEALGAQALAYAAGSQGLDMNRRFFGVYGFQGGAAAYARWLDAWLAQARPGDLIMCHPACDVVPGDAVGAQRMAEYAVLAGRRGNGVTASLGYQ